MLLINIYSCNQVEFKHIQLATIESQYSGQCHLHSPLGAVWMGKTSLFSIRHG